MKQCDLCNGNIVYDENNTGLCKTCREDPFRQTLNRVYEVVGLCSYNMREIKNYQARIAHLEAANAELVEALGQIVANPKDVGVNANDLYVRKEDWDYAAAILAKHKDAEAAK